MPWELNNSDFYTKNNEVCKKNKRRFFINKEIGRINGEATIGATIYLISVFKPKYWFIENPATSKIWDFIKNHWCWTSNEKNKQFFHNKTYYSIYDEKFSLKPTIFLSNVNLKWEKKDKNIISDKDHMARGSYKKRSSIPSKLIKEIIEKIGEKYE